ncbi:unnamed protein product, partial [Wuchereria bancrofti]
MHRNIQRTIITPRFSYVQDFWFADSSEEKWLTYNRLSSAYMPSKMFKLNEEKKPYLLLLDIQLSFVMRNFLASDLIVVQNSINAYGRITNFFHRKQKFIPGQVRNADTMQVRTINGETPLGMFQALPRELLFNLFDRISGSPFFIFFNLVLTLFKNTNQLLSVSLTSSAFNGEVRRYLLTENARRRFLIETIAYMGDDVIEMDPFYSWGQFLKLKYLSEYCFVAELLLYLLGMLLKASTIVMDPQSRRSFLISFYCK